MEESAGVIYILTNPSFPEYVKSDMQMILISVFSSLIGASASRLPFGSMRPIR